eukprot:TRINITY_DN8376_c0_g1_i10.p1 TRINITY_DN8376_c0_g1~~TRINITY_DN8376_c0_g1_i10.p1  ORF type:complete len:317 (-),score=43.86 TRINITY_DN8376_c0_g1_i10:199-1149(-)
MADATRKYNNRLRTEYLDPHTTHEARLNNRPLGVRPEDWAAFFEHNVVPKTIEQRRKNTDVRKKLNIYHTSGRYGHARLEEKLKRQKKEDDPPLTRAEVWIEAHKWKDGSIPSSMSSHVERIQELLSSQEVVSYDILNDPLTKVFGVDTRGRVQGVGNNVSRTQIVSSTPALEKLAAKEKNVKEQSGEIKDLKDEVKHLRSERGGIKQLIELRLRSRSQSSALFPPKMTESVAVSNTIGSIENSMRLRPCQLMSWCQEVVAHGRAHIGNGTQLIHCKAMPENACKVTVDVTEKGDVELPYPDGYNSALGKLGMDPL